jgi:hypothetical protein
MCSVFTTGETCAGIAQVFLPDTISLISTYLKIIAHEKI